MEQKKNWNKIIYAEVIIDSTTVIEFHSLKLFEIPPLGRDILFCPFFIWVPFECSLLLLRTMYQLWRTLTSYLFSLEIMSNLNRF